MFQETEDIEEYKSYINTLKLRDLRDILLHIDKNKYPERVTLVENQINKVLENPVFTPERREEIKKEIITGTNKFQTFWPRFWAVFIDGLVFIPVALLFYFLESNFEAFIIIVLVSIINQGMYTAYSIIMHSKYGQTIGKMACRVKVLDVTENKISLNQAILRDIFPLVMLILFIPVEIYARANGLDPNNLPPDYPVLKTFMLSLSATGSIWFLAEIISMLTNKKRRAVHDFIASTVVIKY